MIEQIQIGVVNDRNNLRRDQSGQLNVNKSANVTPQNVVSPRVSGFI